MYAVVLLLALAQTGPSPSVQFERGRNAFDRGDYARTIQILRPLLYPELRLTTEGQVVQAHRMLGQAYLFEKQNESAAAEFRKLLQLRPDYRFDPLLDNPEVVDFFNGILREQEAELAAIEARRKEAERRERLEREQRERARRGPTIVEKRVLQNSYAVNFIPFGAGQFQNGQRGKGWAFLLGEASLAAISVGAFATNFALYGSRPITMCSSTSVCDRGRENTSRMITRVQVVSGGLFFAVAAWGIADALLHYKPQVELTLTPVPLDGGLGAGLAFRF